VTSIYLTASALSASRNRSRADAGSPAAGEARPAPGESESESQHPHPFDAELKRRKAALLFYMLRTPLFDRATQPAMLHLSSLVNMVPLIGAIPEYILGIMQYLNNSHFYNSASS